MTTQTYRNLAFISYSRKADARLASRLQSDLQNYSIPTGLVCPREILANRRYTRPVFRDHTDLNVRNDSFWKQIETELARSRHLVLLCSPTAAESANIDKEVRSFLESHDHDLGTILPIVVDGDITAETGPQQCLPEVLRRHRRVFLARNLPLASDCTRLELKLKVASWMLGVEYDALYRYHRYRRTRQRVAIAAGTMTILAILGFLTWHSIEKSHLAKERNAFAISEQKAKESQLRQAVSEAWSRSRQSMTSADAFAYLAHAIRFNSQLPSEKQLPGPVADALLRLAWMPDPVRMPISLSKDEIRNISSAKNFPAQFQAITLRHTIRVADTVTSRPVGENIRNVNDVPIYLAAVSPDGEWVVGVSRHPVQSGEVHALRVWDRPSGQFVIQISYPTMISSVQFSPDGRLLATLSNSNETLHIHELGTAPALAALNNRLDLEAVDPVELNGTPSSIEFSDDNRWVIVTNMEGVRSMVPTAKWRAPSLMLRHSGDAIAMFTGSRQDLVTYNTTTSPAESLLWSENRLSPLPVSVQTYEQARSNRSASEAAIDFVSKDEFKRTGESIGMKQITHLQARFRGEEVGPPWKSDGTWLAHEWDTTGRWVCVAFLGGRISLREVPRMDTITSHLQIAEDLEWICGKRVDLTGMVKDVSPSERRQWFAQRKAVKSENAEWDRWVLWRISNPYTRTLSPGSTVAIFDHICRELTVPGDALHPNNPDGDNRITITNEAHLCDPGHPAVHLALALTSDRPATQQQYIRIASEIIKGTGRVQKNARVLATAARLFLVHDDVKYAMEYANDARAVDANNQDAADVIRECERRGKQ